MHHGVELTAVILAIVALFVGVATRQISSFTRVPYTIAMLLLGMACGLLLGRAQESEHPGMLVHALEPVSRISPDLILFVFLPALVFESAYSIDVHVFKNNVGAVVLLAVPALLLATVATGALVMGLVAEPWGWGWPAALVFGALISATDPVAVVAILRELGVSKRLGVLIEGESLLNDGTAIVVFGVLIAILTGEQQEFDAGSAIMSFLTVVSGGIGIGFIIAYLGSLWIEKLFNDPLAEITLTLVMAYSSMIIAEAFFHVSGVMAVVTTGLWMSGTGRTKISPEVSHFLHRFWETLGYIANTLIFFLVGIVIAERLHHTGLSDLALIVAIYLGVMAIRFALVFLFGPLSNKLSDGVSGADNLVISWGGLRGAVSLALGLIVSQDQRIPEELRSKILLVTAGVVLLTIVVNGMTIGKLLSFLGFDKPQLSAQVENLSAKVHVLDRVYDELSEVSQSPDLRTCQWNEVLSDLDQRRARVTDNLAEVSSELSKASELERTTATWRRVLALEKQSYWDGLSEGTLSAHAARLLVREVSRQLDRIARGDTTPPTLRAPQKVAGGLSRVLGGKNAHFDQLALLYDLSRAEGRAAASVLDNLARLDSGDAALIEKIRETYSHYRNNARERIEDLRTNLPEVASAIETRLARRIELNLEREALEELEHSGLVSEAEAHQQIEEVSHRMARLKQSATKTAIPETADLVANTPLFSGLEPAAIQKLTDLTEERIIPRGETLFREGDKGDSLYVIARGAIQVRKLIDGRDITLDVLGGGDIIGEMALLTGEARTATAIASTSVTVGLINRADFESLLKEFPTLSERVWNEVAWRRFDNALRVHPKYAHLKRAVRRAWYDLSGREHLTTDKTILATENNAIFLAAGALTISGARHVAPCLVPQTAGEQCTVHAGSYVVSLDEVPIETAATPHHSMHGPVSARPAERA